MGRQGLYEGALFVVQLPKRGKYSKIASCVNFDSRAHYAQERLKLCPSRTVKGCFPPQQMARSYGF